MKVLVEEGADIETKDNGGRTLLHQAASRGHEAVVRLLVEDGADIRTKDNNGQTPHYLAAYLRHEAVVKLLVEIGRQHQDQRQQ